jgi:hypothetical protein
MIVIEASLPRFLKEVSLIAVSHTPLGHASGNNAYITIHG